MKMKMPQTAAVVVDVVAVGIAVAVVGIAVVVAIVAVIVVAVSVDLVDQIPVDSYGVPCDLVVYIEHFVAPGQSRAEMNRSYYFTYFFKYLI